MANEIDILADKVIEKIKNENYDKTLTIALQKLIYKIQLDNISPKKRNLGYCSNFTIPEMDVLKLLDDVEPGFVAKLSKTFSEVWKIPASVKMANSTYYHVLMFIVLIGAKIDNDILAKLALSLVGFRLWNGRLLGAIPYCDPSTMAYVIQNMNNKFVASKHETPFELILNYFVPKIYTKYKSYILKDSYETKRTWDAIFNRIRQIFRFDPAVDLASGEVKYRSGIQPLYYDAKNKNLKITTTLMNIDSDISTSLSSTQVSDDIDSIVHLISMDQASYDSKFINYVVDSSTAQKYNVVRILNSLHNLQYHDIIREICESIFKRIEDLSQNEICTEKFYNLVQTKIISSKHNKDVTRIKDLCDKLLSDMLKTKIAAPIDYALFKNTTKAKLRRVIILGVCYNIQKFKCK
jgi:hypothetical protein